MDDKWIYFSYLGRNYRVDPQASDSDFIVLPTGVLLRVLQWIASFPPVPTEIIRETLPLYLADATPTYVADQYQTVVAELLPTK